MRKSWCSDGGKIWQHASFCVSDDVSVTSAEHLLQLPQKESVNKDLCCAARGHAAFLTLMLKMNKQPRQGTTPVSHLFVPVTLSQFWSMNAELHIRSGFRCVQGAVSVIGV